MPSVTVFFIPINEFRWRCDCLNLILHVNEVENLKFQCILVNQKLTKNFNIEWIENDSKTIYFI